MFLFFDKGVFVVGSLKENDFGLATSNSLTNSVKKQSKNIDNSFKTMSKDIIEATSDMYSVMFGMTKKYFDFFNKSIDSTLKLCEKSFGKFTKTVDTVYGTVDNAVEEHRENISKSTISIGHDFSVLDVTVSKHSENIKKRLKDTKKAIDDSISGITYNGKNFTDTNSLLEELNRNFEDSQNAYNKGIKKRLKRRDDRISALQGNYSMGSSIQDSFSEKQDNIIDTATFKFEKKRQEHTDSFREQMESVMKEFADKEKERDSLLEQLESASDEDRETIIEDLAKIENRLSELKTNGKNITDTYNKNMATEMNEYHTQLGIAESVSNTAKVVGIIYNIISGIFQPYIKNIEAGLSNYVQWNESNYSKISAAVYSLGETGSESIETAREYFINNNGRLDTILNYVQDYLPKYSELISKGFDSESSARIAQNLKITGILMPWYEQNVKDADILEDMVEKNTLSAYKGLMLNVGKTEAGNRLLEQGYVGSMLSEFSERLTNIEFNTGNGLDDLGDYAEYAKILEANGMSAQEAYAQTKKMIDVDKDVYKALSSGNFMEVALASEIASGRANNTVEAMAKSNVIGNVSGTLSNTNNIGVGAINSVLGIVDWFGYEWKTNDNGKRIDKIIDMIQNNKDIFKNIDENELIEAFSKATSTENLEKMLTPTKKAENATQNAIGTTETVKYLSENIPFFQDYASSMLSAVKGIASLLITKGILGVLGKTGVGSSLLNKFGFGEIGSISKLGFSGIKTAITTGLGKGGILAGGLSTVTAAVVGIASAIYGIYRLVNDGKKGWEKSKEWLGDDKLTSKISSAIGGAIGGTGPGWGDEGTFADKAKNTGSNALKGAAIGAAIGSFIPGIGTLIGGAVGAGIGAVTGAIGGKNIAKFVNTIVEPVGKAFSKVKEVAVGVFDDVKGIWNDDNKSLKDKLVGTFDYFNDKVIGLGKKFTNGISDFIDSIKDGSFQESVKNKFSEIWSSIKESDFYKGAKGMFDDLKSIWNDDSKNLWDKIKTSYGYINEKQIEIVNSIKEKIENSEIFKFFKEIHDAFTEIKNKINSGIKGFFSDLYNATLGKFEFGQKLKGGYGKVKDFLGFSTGIDDTTYLSNVLETRIQGKSYSHYVPYDEMPVLVHGGEMILNKQDAERIRKLKNYLGGNFNSLDTILDNKSNNAMSAINSNANFINWFSKTVNSSRMLEQYAYEQAKNMINADKNVFGLLSNNDSNSLSLATKMASINAISPNMAIANWRGISTTKNNTISEFMNLVKSNIVNNSDTSKSNISIEELSKLVDKLIKTIRESSPNERVKLEDDYTEAIRKLTSVL